MAGVPGVSIGTVYELIMPVLNRSACRCGGTRTDGRCDRCGVAKGWHSGSTKERGYDHVWRRLSERYRAQHPLCERCESLGVVRAASEVHHVIPIDVNPSLRLDPDNLMAVCRECHEALEGKPHPRGG